MINSTSTTAPSAGTFTTATASGFAAYGDSTGYVPTATRSKHSKTQYKNEHFVNHNNNTDRAKNFRIGDPAMESPTSTSGQARSDFYLTREALSVEHRNMQDAKDVREACDEIEPTIADAKSTAQVHLLPKWVEKAFQPVISIARAIKGRTPDGDPEGAEEIVADLIREYAVPIHLEDIVRRIIANSFAEPDPDTIGSPTNTPTYVDSTAIKRAKKQRQREKKANALAAAAREAASSGGTADETDELTLGRGSIPDNEDADLDDDDELPNQVDGLVAQYFASFQSSIPTGHSMKAIDVTVRAELNSAFRHWSGGVNISELTGYSEDTSTKVMAETVGDFVASELRELGSQARQLKFRTENIQEERALIAQCQLLRGCPILSVARISETVQATSIALKKVAENAFKSVTNPTIRRVLTANARKTYISSGPVGVILGASTGYIGIYSQLIDAMSEGTSQGSLLALIEEAKCLKRDPEDSASDHLNKYNGKLERVTIAEEGMHFSQRPLENMIRQHSFSRFESWSKSYAIGIDSAGNQRPVDEAHIVWSYLANASHKYNRLRSETMTFEEFTYLENRLMESTAGEIDDEIKNHRITHGDARGTYATAAKRGTSPKEQGGEETQTDATYRPRTSRTRSKTRGMAAQIAGMPRCKYCAGTHVTRECALRLWDKLNDGLGTHSIPEYREYERSNGREVNEPSARSKPVPVNLPETITLEEYREALVTRQMPTGSGLAKPKGSATATQSKSDNTGIAALAKAVESLRAEAAEDCEARKADRAMLAKASKDMKLLRKDFEEQREELDEYEREADDEEDEDEDTY